MPRLLPLACAAAALMMVLLASAAPARAAGALDKREVDARADFAAGRYQKAVDTFAQLYADTADPVFLRNIGRCYQKMKRPAEAIDSFQEYLHKAKGLGKAERKEIEGYVDEMKALQAGGPPAPTATPSAPSGPMAVPDAPTALTPAPAAAAPPPAPPPPPSPASGTGAPGAVLAAPAPGGATASVSASGGGASWRVAGIAAAAGGVACIAAGVLFGSAASSDADAVAKKYDSATESAGKRDVTLQWVGYGVGAAALATGALLYLHGREPAEGHAGAAGAGLHAVATVDRAGAGLRLEGVF